MKDIWASKIIEKAGLDSLDATDLTTHNLGMVLRSNSLTSPIADEVEIIIENALYREFARRDEKKARKAAKKQAANA
jgi:hypothetical protein